MKAAFSIASVVALAVSASAVDSLSTSSQKINKWLRNTSVVNLSAVPDQEVLATPKEFPELKFTQPLDHFSSSLNVSFGQRYWVNSRHYAKGGPVIVLDGGETSGEGKRTSHITGIHPVSQNSYHTL